MGMQRGARFYSQMWKRMQLRAEAQRTGDPMAVLVEECRNSAEVLNPEVLAAEREIQGLCYFEYELLTPNQRDELFIKALNKAAGLLWEGRHVRGSGAAREIKYNWVHPVLELNTPEVRTAVRSARQHYDAMGLQYLPAIMWVGRAGIWFNGAYGIPRPNQLYSKAAISLLKMDEKWVRQRFEPLSGDVVDPRFLAENFIGHRIQLKALEAIQQHVEGDSMSAHELAVFLRKGVISREEAGRRFGAHLLERAIEKAGVDFSTTTEGDAKNVVDFGHPACLGLSYEATSKVCQECDFKTCCADITHRVRKRQIEIFGTDDPRKLRQREDAARRQRRCRNRKKQALEPHNVS